VTRYGDIHFGLSRPLRWSDGQRQPSFVRHLGGRIRNFLFDFGLAYLGGTLWQKRKARAQGHEVQRPSATGKC